MNIPTPQEQFARAKALRLKFFPPNPPVVIPTAKPRSVEIKRRTYDEVRPISAVAVPGRVYGPFPIAPEFSGMDEATQATSVVRQRRRAKMIARMLAKEAGYTLEELRKPCNKAGPSKARRDGYAEIYLQCPLVGLTEIAAIYNRDHTSVLHGIKKAGVWRGAAARRVR